MFKPQHKLVKGVWYYRYTRGPRFLINFLVDRGWLYPEYDEPMAPWDRIQAGSSVPYPVYTRERYDYWTARRAKYRHLLPAFRTIEKFLGDGYGVFWSPENKQKLYASNDIPF